MIVLGFVPADLDVINSFSSWFVNTSCEHFVAILSSSGCNSVVECLLPKQDVEGSSPFTRSIRSEGGFCYPPDSLRVQIDRYELHCDVRGFSPVTICHVKGCVRYFADFLGGIESVAAVSGDELRKFIVYLKDRKAWP